MLQEQPLAFTTVAEMEERAMCSMNLPTTPSMMSRLALIGIPQESLTVILLTATAMAARTIWLTTKWKL